MRTEQSKIGQNGILRRQFHSISVAFKLYVHCVSTQWDQIKHWTKLVCATQYERRSQFSSSYWWRHIGGMKRNAFGEWHEFSGKQAFVFPLASGRRISALSIMHSLQSLTHFLFAACKCHTARLVKVKQEDKMALWKFRAGGKNGNQIWGKPLLFHHMNIPLQRCQDSSVRCVWGPNPGSEEFPFLCPLHVHSDKKIWGGYNHECHY